MKKDAIEVVQGDITQQAVDAVVNAATCNTVLVLHGFGLALFTFVTVQCQ
jgi:O-acetyl-ADP-ribose deacetylase (regulator of RNase III)